jgi:hypothetical protein
MQPRPPLRALLGVTALLLLVAFGAALAGCGSSSPESTTNGGSGEAVTSGAKAPASASVKSCPSEQIPVRVAGASCAEGRATVTAWTGTRSCQPASGASHSACTIGRFRCIATATGRGLAVNCSGPGRSISFTAPAEEP